MSKANLLLKNDVGLVLDITESPLGCTVYDLEGNEIGSGGVNIQVCDITFINNSGITQEPSSIYMDENGFASYAFAIPSGTTKNAKAVYEANNGEPRISFFDLNNFTASNAVNCEIDGTSINRLAAGPSSITITFS